MAQPIVLHGRVPSKKNSTIAMARQGRVFHFPGNKYREWHKDASYQLPKSKIPDIIELTILFFFPDARKTDLSNKCESILDLLVDNGLLDDDNWMIVPRLILQSGGIDKVNPRCEITWQERKPTTL